MKRYLFNKKYLLIAVVTLMLSACNKNALDETPLDFLAPENSYATIAGIEQGIAGLHFSVRFWWYYGDQVGGTEDVGAIMKGLGSDVAFHGEDPNSTRFLCNYLTYLTSERNTTNDIWSRNYALIQRANALIQGINALNPTSWTNDTQRDSYLAEAMFFRAFAYRILTSFYGDVPLVVDVVKSAKVDFVRAPKDDIYKLMEDDLSFASKNLPQPGEEEAPGRVTQGAAWHMLSELYLTVGKYELAVDASSKVIDGYNYALMTTRFGTRLGKDILGSGDVYFDLFGYDNQNLPENSESIWVIQIEPLITGGGVVNGGRSFGPAYFRMGNTPDGFPAFRGEFVDGKYTGYSDTLGRPVAWIRPTNYASYDIWQSDWKNDIRNAEHSIKRNFYYDSPGSAYDKKKIDFNRYPAGSRDALRDTCQYIYPYFMKFADPVHHFTDPAVSGNGNHHKDLYAIRLAETLLLRAEAYVRLNNLDAAAADINKIRNRAQATPVSPSNVTLDYVLDERARELYGEEWRHITLRRMGKLVERVKRYNNNPKNPGLNIQDYNVLWPIPQAQIVLNIDAKIDQNPGY